MREHKHRLIAYTDIMYNACLRISYSALFFICMCRFVFVSHQWRLLISCAIISDKEKRPEQDKWCEGKALTSVIKHYCIQSLVPTNSHPHCKVVTVSECECVCVCVLVSSQDLCLHCTWAEAATQLKIYVNYKSSSCGFIIFPPWWKLCSFFSFFFYSFFARQFVV